MKGHERTVRDTCSDIFEEVDFEDFSHFMRWCKDQDEDIIVLRSTPYSKIRYEVNYDFHLEMYNDYRE